MSLRIRLSLIASLLFLLGIIVSTSFLLSNAKQRVAEEVASTANLTYQLLESLISSSPEQNNKAELLQKLSGIEEARHMTITIISSVTTQSTALQESLNVQAPSWFVALVRPDLLEFKIPLNNALQEIILISTNPADEIAEVWEETKRFMLVLFLVLLMLNGILFFTIGHWFKPIRNILEGLSEVEQGNFSGQIPQSSLPELKVIAEKLNQLTVVLKASKDENDRLAQHSLNVQEEERRYLAQELHDEMGQSISAINAIAFSIGQRNKDKDEMSVEGATQISVIANRVGDHVRTMMGRLRPSVLDELGLVSALQNMVDEWNSHYENIFCRLNINGDFTDLNKHHNINIYRIIQEALTNVAKHSSADKVNISLINNQALLLSIEDNGCGFDNSTTLMGMGLTGINERARAINGVATVKSEPGTGVKITIQADLN